jgi:hypothetical protein
MHLNKGCPWKNKNHFVTKVSHYNLHLPMDQFSHFHCSNLKHLKCLSIWISCQNSHEILENSLHLIFKINFHQVLTRRQGNTQIWIIICHNSLQEVFQNFHWWQKQANLVLQNMKKHFEKMVKTTSQLLLKYWWRKIINLVTCTFTSTYRSMKAVCFVLFCIVLYCSYEIHWTGMLQIIFWCLWKALDEEGCMGSVPWHLHL